MSTEARGSGSQSPSGRRAAKRDRTSILACLTLLAVPWVAPDGDYLRSARGLPRLDGELRRMQTHGYYEELIDANRSAPSTTAPAADAPPPGWVPFGASEVVDAVPGYIRWKLKPNLDVVWNGERFRTESRGYRTPEFAVPKPPDVYRILLFGSSNTMGHGVGDDDAYPRLLERWLNEAVEGPGRIEVVNLSVSGDSPSRRLARMHEEAAALEPDWIWCDATVLDPALEESHLETVARGDAPAPIPPHLDYVREALARAGVSPSDPPRVFRSKLQRQAESLLKGAYAGWAAFGRQLGTPMAVVVIPRADAKVENPAIVRIMREAIDREGLEALDAGLAFDGLTAEEFRVSPWDKHPSVRGHRAIFEALRDALRERGALPGGPALGRAP